MMNLFNMLPHLAGVLLSLFLLQASDPVEIKLKNHSEAERRGQAQLERLLEKYDLTKWTFTGTVVIDEKSRIPHSHPVLTLNTGALDDDLGQLSNYVHEQLHWFFDERQKETRKATEDLQEDYPEIPKGPPEGARDERSTYLHLLVCYLEYDALKQLVGPEQARMHIERLAGHHYKWVYRTTLKDGDKLRAILERHSLIP